MEIELLYDVFQEEIPIPIAPYGDDIENQQIKVKKKNICSKWIFRNSKYP